MCAPVFIGLCVHGLELVCVFIMHNVLNVACVNCQKSTATAAAYCMRFCKIANGRHTYHAAAAAAPTSNMNELHTEKHIKPAPKCTHNNDAAQSTTATATATATTVALDSTVQLHFGTVFIVRLCMYSFAWKMTRFRLFMHLRFAAQVVVVAVVLSFSSSLSNQTCHN